MGSNNLTVYAAGPIDLGKDVPNWREKLRKKLEENYQHVTIFDPSTSYKLSDLGRVNEKRDTYIEYINKVALDAADVMVVVLPARVQSVGTPIEMDIAFRQSKKIVLVTDIPRGKSIYLNNRVAKENWIYIADLQKSEKYVDAALDFLVNNLMGVKDL